LLDELSENRNASPSKSSLRLRGRSAFPLGAFSSPVHRRRISLLPNTHCPVRLLQMTIEGAEGFRRTMVRSTISDMQALIFVFNQTLLNCFCFKPLAIHD
jgi:hypothetical protein